MRTYTKNAQSTEAECAANIRSFFETCKHFQKKSDALTLFHEKTNVFVGKKHSCGKKWKASQKWTDKEISKNSSLIIISRAATLGKKRIEPPQEF